MWTPPYTNPFDDIPSQMAMKPSNFQKSTLKKKQQIQNNKKNIYQGPHSFSFFELKTFLKTSLFTTLTTYCKKFAIFLRKHKIH